LKFGAVFAISRDIILTIGVILRLRDAPADILGRVVVAADLGFSAGMIVPFRVLPEKPHT
jgi:hypothetical protein